MRRLPVKVIVPAAGLGVRFGGSVRKPFFRIHGRPVLAWTLGAFELMDSVDEVVPAVHGDDVEACRGLVKEYRLGKVKGVVVGGKERQDSVHNAISALGAEDCVVLVHDGARPLVTDSLVEAVVSGIDGYDGAIAAVPLKDTVKQVGDDGTVLSTPERRSLWAVQTPQGFRLRVLREAYESAMAEGFYSTDDSALVERRGGRVRVVMGSYDNVKITTPEDASIAELLIGRNTGEGAASRP